MQPITFFEIASQHARWLSERQKVVSENIAHASTPHYRAKDVSSFESVLNNNFDMDRTHVSHLKESDSQGFHIKTRIVQAPLDQAIGVQVSGNTVGLTNELYKSGYIKNLYDLNTRLVGKLNSMMMSIVKG
ncbi:MAG: flagellar basal body rod protein FlgB [Candidatus Liberibacter ctenarytainae]|uniref:Flagellar basal body rod protein FlgB n=1 Tax=Candidatus Liberibacter ctenarytainae TaxID=2020335 RepID=A0A937DGM9_9HYPH|nr:flagellar basal body rod protein FlgB [Candidatus Liberibacter ctenarytainae]